MAYTAIKLLAFYFVLLLSYDTALYSQESVISSSIVDSEVSNPWTYRTLGFRFADVRDGSSTELDENKRFQEFVQMNAPFSYIGLPHFGDFHFQDYNFVDEASGLLKYRYFLAVGELAPTFYLFDSNSNKGNIRISLATHIRIWNKRRKPLRSSFEWGASNAVKTPSYLPGIYYSRLLSSFKKDGRSITDYIEIGFTHHSNGQDSPTLSSQDSTLLIRDDYKYNINDGDFSTNFISVGFNRLVDLENSASVIHSLMFYFDGIGKERIEHEDLHIYRMNYKYSYLFNTKNKEMVPGMLPDHRIGLELGFGFNSLDRVTLSNSVSAELNYHYRIPFSKRFALFCRYGYKAQDDYNIFLEQSLHYLRFGFSSIIK